MADRRRNIRIHHEDAVTIAGEGQTFQARVFDISRTGMRILATVPLSEGEVRRVLFTLPQAPEVEIPCTVVRTQGDAGQPDGTGLSFDYETEAQALLVERFVEEQQRRQMLADTGQESRQRLRVRCSIADVSVDLPQARLLAIDDISCDGFLIRFVEGLTAGHAASFTFRLPGDERPIQVRGRIVYVVQNTFRSVSSAGVRFEEIGRVGRTRITNYVVAASTTQGIRGVHERLSTVSPQDEYLLSGERVTELLSSLAQEQVSINFLVESSATVATAVVTGRTAGGGSFLARPGPGFLAQAPQMPAEAYCSFPRGGGCYYFRTSLERVAEGVAEFLVPDLVCLSERRSDPRKVLGREIELSVTDGAAEHRFPARLVDVNRRGFLCEARPTEGAALLLAAGRPVSYDGDAALGLRGHGEIRHVSGEHPDGQASVYRIGVEIGTERKAPRTLRYSERAWARRRLIAPPEGLDVVARIRSTLVTYPSADGRQISALLTTTGDQGPAPVVVIPPAFGKKKETLSPLVLSLMTDALALGVPLATIRYGGVKSGLARDMLDYRVRQGVEDLGATLDFLSAQPGLRADRVILVAFSMSAIDVRRYLAQGLDRGRVVLWINVMGLPAAQGTLSNVLGGIDIVGNYRMGIPSGVGGMMGHIVDLDRVAAELVELRHASLADARADMARLAQPTLWIYGSYDRWVNPEEVLDIMSIRSPGSRQVIEIPTGHNLRTSEDAVRAFGLISEALFRQVRGQRHRSLAPGREDILRLIEMEQEPILRTETLNLETYWRGYLMGEGPEGATGSEGYDFYRNLPEFRDFLTHETRLLELAAGDRVADLGCGTGLLLERMLEVLATYPATKGETPGIRILAADLVPEALASARRKCERVRAEGGGLDHVHVDFRQMNLEPNGLLPVKRMMDTQPPDPEQLRGRVVGLPGALLDRLRSERTPELDHLLTGGSPDGIGPRLETQLGREHADALLDLNLAARFLRRSLDAADVRPDRRPDRAGPLEPETYESLRSSDLAFRALSLGSGGLGLRIDLPDGSFDKVAASLLLSYLRNPVELLREIWRILSPGGLALASSMRPDSDVSVMFTRYVAGAQGTGGAGAQGGPSDLAGARTMLNEAASLFELAEDGYFRFYSEDELEQMLSEAGFKEVSVRRSLGEPAQAVIAVGRKTTPA